MAITQARRTGDITPVKHRRLLFVVLGSFALATLAVLCYLIWSDYRQEIRSAQTRTRDYAAVLEARFDATLRRADATLRILARDLQPAALSKPAVPLHAGAINADLDAHMVDFAELAGLRIFDNAGDQLYSSNRANTPLGNVADRYYLFNCATSSKTAWCFQRSIFHAQRVDPPWLLPED